MRGVRFAACMAALLCGACAARVVPSPTPTPTENLVPVVREPAGYYPGDSFNVVSSFRTADQTAWLAEHRAAIDDIQTRIVEIREGRRGPGCIGEDRYTCVASLAQRFAVADNYAWVDKNIFAPTKYDVNGKPVVPKITFDGYVPLTEAEKNRYADNRYERLLEDTSRRPTKFFLTLGPGDRVTQFAARLAKDPTFARTQEDYDATDAYETVAALTARTCPNLAKAEVANWIENTIKPGSKAYSGKIRRGVAALKISQQTKFCGRTFQFDSVWAARTYNQYRRDVIGGMFLLVD